MKIVQYNDNWQNVCYNFRLLLIDGDLYDMINQSICGSLSMRIRNNEILNLMEIKDV